MPRFLLRSALLAASLASAAPPAFAQVDGAPRTRAIVTPQVGAVIGHSRGGEANVLASLMAEMPVGRGFSLAAEWTRPYGGYAIRACPATSFECDIGAELRSTGAVGVIARPVRVGPLEPYAGVSVGAARWAYDWNSGIAPMAVARAGLDVRIAGPVGLRADLVRRAAWTGTRNGSPMHTDMFSLGARIAFRR
jgi:hypothetical protein